MHILSLSLFFNFVMLGSCNVFSCLGEILKVALVILPAFTAALIQNQTNG